jgi:hypothetical protein
MKSWIYTACASLAVASAAAATDLNLDIRANGVHLIDVGPGQTVTYTVTGTLNDNASLGLAMFCFDLTYTGGNLTQAQTPTTDPMKRFAVPEGVNNPAGYGGTLVLGQLQQVGGAQNTINNTFAPIPNGTVLTNVAQPSSPAVLAQGTIKAPDFPGTYTLTAGHLFANVIRQGETGTPFWHVDPCGAGTNQQLLVRVGAIHPDPVRSPLFVHHSQTLRLNAGARNAGRRYILLGSISGTSPGTVFENGATLPLNSDAYFSFTRSQPNSPILSNSFGVLDENGRATAIFTPDARFANKTVSHAFLVLGPSKFVSEAETCVVFP